jgi:peptidoglycan-associated lipoprotein
MRTNRLISLASLALAAACSKSSPPPEPQPDPTPEVALMNQDSLEAAKRFTADSLERVRQEQFARQAYADSVERARLASLKSVELRNELAVMVHFNVGQSAIMSNETDGLDRKVAILNANPAVRLRITGACDERGSDDYNRALGERRAAAVKQYLVGKGISDTRLENVSFGETSPIDAGSYESAWAQNRRAEFAITSGDQRLAMSW